MTPNDPKTCCHCSCYYFHDEPCCHCSGPRQRPLPESPYLYLQSCFEGYCTHPDHETKNPRPLCLGINPDGSDCRAVSIDRLRFKNKEGNQVVDVPVCLDHGGTPP